MIASLVALLLCLPFGCAAEDDDLASVSGPVLGGTFERNDFHPWVVHMSPLGCHGVLIHPRWVLIAAHCVYPGNLYTFTAPVNEPTVAQQRTMLSEGDGKFIHPEYVGGVEHDIALIRLPTPFTINRHVQTIGLPTNSLGIGDNGWFASSTNNTPGTSLPDGYLSLYRAPVVGTFCSTGDFCTEVDTASACHSDSGSGFVNIVDHGNGRLRATVFGLVSHGEFPIGEDDCFAPGEEVGFADVFLHLDWILGEDQMNMTALQVAGNTTMASNGLLSEGTMRLDCNNSGGTPVSAEALMNVPGVELGLTCFNSTIESTCDLQGLRPDREIQGFSVTQLVPTGGTTPLPFSPAYAHDETFIVAYPPTRRFECQTELPFALYIPLI